MSHGRPPDLDLGQDHLLWFFGWAPDRDLNPQFEGIPDEARSGATIDHPKPDGTPCSGAVTFNTEAMVRTQPERALWTVVSEDPLTLSPSIQCSCGDHGFITDGKWVPA